MKQDPTWQECFSEWEKSGNPAVRRLVRRCRDLEECLSECMEVIRIGPIPQDAEEIKKVLNKNPSEYGEME